MILTLVNIGMLLQLGYHPIDSLQFSPPVSLGGIPPSIRSSSIDPASVSVLSFALSLGPFPPLWATRVHGMRSHGLNLTETSKLGCSVQV